LVAAVAVEAVLPPHQEHRILVVLAAAEVRLLMRHSKRQHLDHP
jgi:hypothetical protein